MRSAHVRSSSRRTRTLTTLAALSLLIGSCSAGSTATGTDTAGSGKAQSLTVAVSADPRSMWANSNTVQYEMNFAEQINEKLIEFNPDATGFEPRLATAWDQVDPRTLRLTLREGVKFSNGEEFTADSAKKSLEIMANAKAYKSYVPELTEIRVVDGHTLEIVSAKPSGLLLNALALGSFQYPPALWDKVGEKGFSTEPVGTGPFIFERWTKGQEIVLKANPAYWGGKPKISTLTFKVIPDSASQVAAFQSKQVDFIQDVPVGSLPRISSDKSATVVTRPSNRMFGLILSSIGDSSLKDPAVRQALQYGIDVKSIIDNQLNGNGVPLAAQYLTPGYFGYDDSMQAAQYDPEKAKKLLAEAGHPNGLTIRLNYTSGRYAQDKEIGQALAAQLAKIGLKVEQQVYEPGAFLTQMMAFKLNDVYFGGLLLPPDAHFVYDFLENGPYPYAQPNSTIDGLLKQDAVTSDPAVRKDLIAQMSRAYLEDPQVIPMFQGVDVYATGSNVSGFVPRASQFLDFQTVSVR